MFIRKNPRKDHVYYNVVKGIRKEGTVKQEQVAYIGRVDTMTPERRQKIETELRELEEGEELLRDFRELLIEHDYDFASDPAFADGYPLDEIDVKNAVDYGPVAALHATAEKLDLQHVLETHFPPKGGGPSLGKLLLIQIIARCIEPRSIAATTDWFPPTALPGLIDLPPESASADTFYNSLDYIDQEGIERVHEELWTRVQDLYDTPEDPLFYDLTSSYFEGTRCPLAKYGYSSEHRPDKQQIVMGVTVNPDMVPLQHEVYSGETNHSTTVDDVAHRIDELEITDPVLVMDKGCATSKKRKRLRGDDPTAEFAPIDYVAALKNYTRVTELLADIDVEEFDSVELPDGASPLAVTELDSPDDVGNEQVRWIATYNEEKAQDDADYRQEKLTEASEQLEKLAERQHGTHSLSKADLLEKINSKLTTEIQELIVTEINERGPPRLSWEINEEAVAEAAKLDGKAMFETTRAAEKLSAAAVALAYRDRDTVEKFMQSIKDIGRLRPHYVYIACCTVSKLAPTYRGEVTCV